MTEEDLKRERQVEAIVAENLARWQDDGLVPDMAIEPGDKTDEPIRTRGWMYWHQLFNRHGSCLLLVNSSGKDAQVKRGLLYALPTC